MPLVVWGPLFPIPGLDFFEKERQFAFPLAAQPEHAVAVGFCNHGTSVPGTHTNRGHNRFGQRLAERSWRLIPNDFSRNLSPYSPALHARRIGNPRTLYTYHHIATHISRLRHQMPPDTHDTMEAPPVSQYQGLENGLRQDNAAGARDEILASLDRHGFLFGKKITNSLSPYLHGVVYRELGLNWAQVRLDSDDMESFLKLIRNPRFYGE